ncbi:hypothetical protein ONS95_007082 [Cadophora gregata]|uniref:uncharacterized protein n=1 Tax=Cadophora gregata TaxID=51156 RepID=UPI0026DC8947|nr:uncharacterized protein ONS95_007082 [Cadophora gregata]KAK0100627.1 hypothetical protein ONS95_007082 [Cadophora gregata]
MPLKKGVSTWGGSQIIHPGDSRKILGMDQPTRPLAKRNRSSGFEALEDRMWDLQDT